MVAWYWLIVSAVGGIVFTKFCDEYFDWDNVLTEIISWIALVVLYIPLFIYHVFFKLTIKPVSADRLEEFHLVPFKRWGNLALFVDKKAHSLWNKVFFLRFEK